MKHSKENEALKEQGDTFASNTNLPSSDRAESLLTPGSGRSSPSREWLGDTSATLHLLKSIKGFNRFFKAGMHTKYNENNFYFIANIS